jgi:uncharacterized membrane protein YedE/YeeE
MSPRDRIVIGVFSVLGTVALIAGIIGFLVMAYANSPANRQGNELADIGVLYGGIVGVAGVLIAGAFFITVAIQYRSANRR